MAIKIKMQKRIPIIDYWKKYPAKIMPSGHMEDVRVIRLVPKPYSITISEPAPETMIIGNDCVMFIPDTPTNEGLIIDEYVGETVNTQLQEDRFEILGAKERTILKVSYEPTLPRQSTR